MALSAAAKTPVSEETLGKPTDVAAAFERWLARTGLAENTKKAYAKQVRSYAVWLEAHAEEHPPVETFVDKDDRNFAAREYRLHLLKVKKAAPRTVGQAISALGVFYDWLGTGKPHVPGLGRHALDDGEGRRGLTPDDRKAVLRAAERRGVRDHALVVMLVFTGLRISELAALDVDDVWVTERAGKVHVRAGKGDQPRQVDLPPHARSVLRTWLVERRSWIKDPAETAMWPARATGRRISDRNLRKAVTEVGKAAGVDMSPHVLRHTFGETHAREYGTDIALVASYLGHSDVKTTAKYQKATAETRAAVAEKFHIDY